MTHVEITEEFLKFTSPIHPVDPEIIDRFLYEWTPVEFKRREIITREGQTERYLYFVLEGIQRSYRAHEDKEHVLAFTYPPSFSGIPGSFLTQSPSKYFLESVTESRMIRVRYKKFNNLIESDRQLERLFRKATELILAGVLDRHYELLAHTIEERFKLFTKRSPHLLTMVPHKHIASYLGIDPTNFSKLLGRVKI